MENPYFIKVWIIHIKLLLSTYLDNPLEYLMHGASTYQDRPMYLIRAVTVHSNRPKEVWFGPSAYTARILWSGGEIFLLRALGDHLWGHSEALWALRRAACAERRRRQLPKPLPVSGAVCWRSGLGNIGGGTSACPRLMCVPSRQHAPPCTLLHPR